MDSTSEDPAVAGETGVEEDGKNCETFAMVGNLANGWKPCEWLKYALL